MKLSILILTAFCFCSMLFSQEKSLFSNLEHNSLENLAIKKNDSSILYKQLFDGKDSLTSSFLLSDYEQTVRRKAFLESENSATKNPMPIYKPKGNYKHKSIFPDNTMKYYLLREPVKER